MELGKRDRFINKIVNSFVLIIIGESLSLYYIFASRTRVPILVRATILVTILQWPSYSICPATAVLFHLSDYNRLPYNDGLAPLSLHNRFHFAVSTVAGDYENENSIIIISLPIKFYSTMPRWLDFSFTNTIRFDSIGGIGVGEKSPPPRSRVKGRRNFARSKHVLDPLQEEEG